LLLFISILYYSVCHWYFLWPTHFDVYIGVILSVDIADVVFVFTTYLFAPLCFFLLYYLQCVYLYMRFCWCCCYTYICPCLVLVNVSTSCCACLLLWHTSALVLALVYILCSSIVTWLPNAGSYYWASVFNNVFPRCHECQRREAGNLKRLL
jgi:hypothetical protein